MLRAHGVGVTFIPTIGASLSEGERLESIGCKIIVTGKTARGTVSKATADDLASIPGLKDSIVISMCNVNFTSIASLFRNLGCKIGWINCMTFCFPEEIQHYYDFGRTFEAYVFQSEWQRKILETVIGTYGYQPEQGHLIRGAFDCSEFPFNPLERRQGMPFMIGRISRAAPDKYSSDLWSIYNRIPCYIKARAMAWSEEVERKCATAEFPKPPDWATCLPSCAETAQDFYSQLHCLLQINGGAGENWPRSGLEAMAAGVPIVAQNQWGWPEMIEHGVTGYLADLEDEANQLSYYPARLAYDESHRIDIVEQARWKLEHELANPELIWPAWERMLKGLS